MRILFKVLPLIVIATVACSKTPNLSYDVPKYEAPKIPDLDLSKLGLEKYSTCDKHDAEKSLTPADIKNRIIYQDTIERKNTQTVDCDGKVISKVDKLPVRKIKNIKIAPPTNDLASRGYTRVSIENTRTCVTRSVIASDPNQPKTELQKVMAMLNSPGTSDLDGNLDLSFTDSQSTLFGIEELNVREGLNVMKLQYRTSCLGTDTECSTPALAEQTVVLDVHVKYVDVPGVVTTVSCTKN